MATRPTTPGGTGKRPTAPIRRGTARRLAVALARTCAENRCRNVTVLDLRRLSPVTDFFVVATGTSDRQMRAAADHAGEAAKEMGQRPFSIEGDEAGWWVLQDYVDVVLHVFTDESRKYYDLELLWGDAPRVDWQKGWNPRETET
ncbi:MAG: ribosome silencing factor [Phycisphaerae bacterium]|nr:ribosome silencing factor [Phycisphaerae bacterium]